MEKIVFFSGAVTYPFIKVYRNIYLKQGFFALVVQCTYIKIILKTHIKKRTKMLISGITRK